MRVKRRGRSSPAPCRGRIEATSRIADEVYGACEEVEALAREALPGGTGAGGRGEYAGMLFADIAEGRGLCALEQLAMLSRVDGGRHRARALRLYLEIAPWCGAVMDDEDETEEER